eukprot:2074992-Pyramimonas_sp.AAC.1
MVAGSAWAGELKDYKIITTQEHRLAAGQRLVMHHLASAADRELQQHSQSALLPTSAEDREAIGMRGKFCGMEVVTFKGDATHQEACEKSKMYLSTVATMHCNINAVMDAYAFNATLKSDSCEDPKPIDEPGPCHGANASDTSDGEPQVQQIATSVADHLASRVESAKGFGVMQSVEHGTAQELWRIVVKSFQSVGVTHPDDRSNQYQRDLQPAQRILRVYAFGFDKVGTA